MANLAPIVLFVYKRDEHTLKTLQSISAIPLAKESRLYVFSDGAKGGGDWKSVQKTRALIRKISGFAEVRIIERPYNFGRARNIIAGVTQVIQDHGRAIVIENDLNFSPDFLLFMNEALDFYEHDPHVFSVSGYSHSSAQMPVLKDYTDDVYFCRRASSWGWATWKDRWDKAEWDMRWFEENRKDPAFLALCRQLGDDFPEMLAYQSNGQMDSWAVRWSLTCLKHNGVCVYPRRSLVKNIGLDGSGVHSRAKDHRVYGVDLLAPQAGRKLVEWAADRDLTAHLARAQRFGLLTRIKKLVKKFLGWILFMLIGLVTFLMAAL